MTTMATASEQIERSEQDDVQGYVVPVLVALTVLAFSVDVALVIGYTGPADVGTLKAIKPRDQLVGGGGQTPR